MRSRLLVLACVSKRFSAEAARLRHRAARRGTGRAHAYSPYASFDGFLSRARLVRLALPNFVGLPPTAHELPPGAAPRLAILHGSLDLPLAFTPGCPLRRVTRGSPACYNDSLRPTALSGSALKGLVLVLAPEVDVRMLWRLFGAPAIRAWDSRRSS